MRAAADDPTIGVSCGHRVPRVPVKLDGAAGNRYWCETCGAHRMSGGRASGVGAFDFLLELRDEVAAREIAVDCSTLEPWQVRVVQALGARPA